VRQARLAISTVVQRAPKASEAVCRSST
jgi:hypothetical protein